MSGSDIWRTHYNHPCRWDQSFAPLTLPELFETTVRASGDKPVIDFFGRRFSYREIARQVDRFACGLQALGIERGDRVGLFLPNVPQYLVGYFGALKLGAIVVNFSPLYSVEELTHQVEDSGTRLLVTIDNAKLLPIAKAVLDASSLERLVVGSIAEALTPLQGLLYRVFRRREIAPLPKDPHVLSFAALLANAGGCPPPRLDAENDIALIQYTGGTTGTPKGAILTHQNLTANARQIHAVDPHVGDLDRILGVLPLFHVFANSAVLNRTIWAGGEIVMLPRFDSGQVLKTIRRARPTTFPGVPTMFQALLDDPAVARTDFSSLRTVISGGAPLPGALKQRFQDVTGVPIAEGYGLTETSGVASVNPYEGDNRSGTIGQPLPGTQFVLVDKEDPEQPAASGEPGEITIAGPQIMRGYWKHAEEDAKVFVDGRLRTGDVGLIDADGYIKIVDRLKDMIVVGGFKVFPTQVEEVLYHNPAIREAVVVGVPDAYLGERPMAFVTLAASAVEDGETLMRWANSRLGKHERLTAVEIRDSLPKTLIGKLSRKELKEEARARAASA